jgi:hypothetical protein
MSLPLTGAGSSYSSSYSGGSLGPVLDGLILRVDGRDSYPGSGTTWFDMTANGNTLTIQNDYDVIYQESAYFNTGATGFFSRPSITGMTGGNHPYTVMVCVRRGGLPWTNAGFWSIGTASNNRLNAGYARGELEGRTQVSWWINELTADLTNVAEPWFVFSSTWDGTERNIYQNGSLAASDSPPPTLDITSTLLYLCNVNGFTGYKWQADISAALIYDRALTQSEISSNASFLLGRAPPGPTPPLPATTMVWSEGTDPLIYQHPEDVIIYGD